MGDYKFPFKAESFDFIFLASVFTHLQPEDLEHYLKEINRMLKSSGRVFISLFLLNEKQKMLEKQGKNLINFRFNKGVFSSTHNDMIEWAVAYNEDYILNLLKKYNFKCQVSPGAWTGGQGVFGQDIIIARK